MDFTFFLWGLLVWFIISLPIWAVSLLWIHRSLQKGMIFGFVTGLGIATADMFWTYVSIHGMILLQEFLSKYSLWIELFWALFLFFIWRYIFFSHKTKSKEFHTKWNIFKNYITAFSLSIINVANLLFIWIIFSKILPYQATTLSSELLLIFGVFLGITLWWIFLSYTFSHFKLKINKIYIVNKIMWILIVVLSLWSFLRTVLLE